MKDVKNEESWVAKTTTVMKNTTEVENTKSLISCWKKAYRDNASFFFWNSTGNSSCHLSNGKTQLCATNSSCPQNEKIQVPSEGSITVRTNFCLEISFNSNQCQDSGVFLFKDPIYKCASLNETNCIFYKRRIYSIWSNALETPWIYVCVLLCSIYVFIGVPVLICMSKDEPKHQSTEHFTIEFVPKTRNINKKENLYQSTRPYDHIREPSVNATEDSDRITIYENDESCGYVPK